MIDFVSRPIGLILWGKGPEPVLEFCSHDLGRGLKHVRVGSEIEDVALEPRLLIGVDLVATQRGELR